MAGDYYLLKTEFDPKNCVIDKMPSGTKQEFRIKSGEAMGSRFPKNATMQMSKSYAGHAVTDAIANTFDFLMVTDRLRKLIAEFRPDGIEYLPFALRNHKGGPVPGEFWIVNPLGSIACVDSAGTEGKKSSMQPDQFLLLSRLSIDESMVPEGTHLFRLGEMTHRLLASNALIQAARKLGVKGLRYVRMGEKI